MLTSNTDRPARLYFAANGFRVIAPGDHVLCAVTGERIPIDSLRYWSVALQQPYASAAVAMSAMTA
ncbi:MAG: DUF2093 domain-containing protein [Sphingomonas sp.]|nr:DUF2093 domain-containing protein [Sphingomonas sp.]